MSALLFRALYTRDSTPHFLFIFKNFGKEGGLATASKIYEWLSVLFA